MSSSTEAASNNGLDIVKIIIAVAIIVAAIAGYYIYDDHSTLLRVVALLISIGIAAWVFLHTTQGRTFSEFFHSAQVEVRKVVWPTRQETIQTTGLVMITVVVAGAFFWALDSVLGKLIRLVIGG